MLSVATGAHPVGRAAVGGMALLVLASAPGCGRLRAAPGPAPLRNSSSVGQIAWRVRTSKKVVALTLDDGPNPKYTPVALKIAREHKAKLTFFVLGREVEQHPELVRQAVREGHAIANHGWDHTLLTERGSRKGTAGGGTLSEVARKQIRSCEEAVAKACQVHTDIFRPPKGMWDSETSLAAESLGYRMALWTITLEHHSAPSPQEMADRVIDRITPGTIILAHDGEPKPPIDRRKTIAALPLLIDGLREKGYEFVTAPELLALAKGE